MNLYGQDMTEADTPLECGLAWTVDLESPRDFVGKAALSAAPIEQQQVGLILQGKGGVLRSHQKVLTAKGGGEITSGTFSPTLAQSIALARVPVGMSIVARKEVPLRKCNGDDRFGIDTRESVKVIV